MLAYRNIVLSAGFRVWAGAENERSREKARAGTGVLCIFSIQWRQAWKPDTDDDIKSEDNPLSRGLLTSGDPEIAPDGKA